MINLLNFKKSFSVFFGILFATSAFAIDVDVSEFKALADEKTDNTIAIQQAIDKCSATGGGYVTFSQKGTYLTSTIFLKDNVILNVPQSVILKGNKIKDVDNPNYKVALIRAEGANNIGIVGKGSIDGNGANFVIKDCAPGRSRLVKLDNCKNVKIQDITLQNPATWTLNLFQCDTVIVDRVRINSQVNFNNDGIDINSKNVVISNCIIDSDDDAICIKNTGVAIPKTPLRTRDFTVENITITNCLVSSNCNYIKIGTETWSDIKNITISNCVLKPCSASNHRIWHKGKVAKRYNITDPIMGVSGIALEAVDGCQLENIAISNIIISGVHTPIFIRCAHRNKDELKSSVKNILIQNVIAKSNSNIASSITSIPEHTLENVVIRDSIFSFKGSVDEESANKYIETPVPEVENKYPECRHFYTPLPAYAFYIRHAKNITLDNVQIRQLNKDYRHAIVADDVETLRLFDCQIQKPAGDKTPIKLIGSKKVTERNTSILD